MKTRRSIVAAVAGTVCMLEWGASVFLNHMLVDRIGGGIYVETLQIEAEQMASCPFTDKAELDQAASGLSLSQPPVEYRYESTYRGPSDWELTLHPASERGYRYHGGWLIRALTLEYRKMDYPTIRVSAHHAEPSTCQFGE